MTGHAPRVTGSNHGPGRPTLTHHFGAIHCHIEQPCRTQKYFFFLESWHFVCCTRTKCYKLLSSSRFVTCSDRFRNFCFTNLNENLKWNIQSFRLCMPSVFILGLTGELLRCALPQTLIQVVLIANATTSHEVGSPGKLIAETGLSGGRCITISREEAMDWERAAL